MEAGRERVSVAAPDPVPAANLAGVPAIPQPGVVRMVPADGVPARPGGVPAVGPTEPAEGRPEAAMAAHR